MHFDQIRIAPALIKVGLPGGSPKGSFNQNVLFYVSVDAQQLNIGILCGQQEEAGSIGRQIGHDGAGLGHGGAVSAGALGNGDGLAGLHPAVVSGAWVQPNSASSDIAASSSANTRFVIKIALFYLDCNYSSSAVGI